MKKSDVDLVRWAEVNQLRAVGVLPEGAEGARLEEATPVFDLNGEELFRRTPLRSGRRRIGYVDIAVSAALGEPFISVSFGAVWDEATLRREGEQAARRSGIDPEKADEVRFVAYSFPKLGLQFLRGKEELALLEAYTWEPVPPLEREQREFAPPGDFERWSYLDEMPDDERRMRVDRFEERVARWKEALPRRPKDLAVIDRSEFLRRFGEIERLVLGRTRELHYSTRSTDHYACYELRGQQTNVWCVGASVQMLLDFYRYEYGQVRLAQELGLGTLSNPNGLPYSRDGDVVTVIERLTCNGLNAAMTTSPFWSEFEAEIDANRPLISFIPGHSRTVAGYTRSFISIAGQTPFRGLLVYDPWPPNAGVITRWENFNVTTYRRTFTARVCRV